MEADYGLARFSMMRPYRPMGCWNVGWGPLNNDTGVTKKIFKSQGLLYKLFLFYMYTIICISLS